MGGNVFSKSWWKACAIRMVRTFAEAALAYIGTGAVVLGDVNWIACLSAGAMGAVLAFLLALASLPEASYDSVKYVYLDENGIPEGGAPVTFFNNEEGNKNG